MGSSSEKPEDLDDTVLCHYLQGVSDCIAMVLDMRNAGQSWDQIGQRLTEYHTKISHYKGNNLKAILQELL